MRLIEQNGELAEHGAALGHADDLNAVLDDGDRSLLEKQELLAPRPGKEHDFARLELGERKRAEALLNGFGIGN